MKTISKDAIIALRKEIGEYLETLAERENISIMVTEAIYTNHYGQPLDMTGSIKIRVESHAEAAGNAKRARVTDLGKLAEEAKTAVETAQTKADEAYDKFQAAVGELD